jgi:hypothetical protein
LSFDQIAFGAGAARDASKTTIRFWWDVRNTKSKSKAGRDRPHPAHIESSLGRRRAPKESENTHRIPRLLKFDAVERQSARRLGQSDADQKIVCGTPSIPSRDDILNASIELAPAESRLLTQATT